MLEIAGAVVAFLAPFLNDAGKTVAQKAGEAAFKASGRLLSAVRRKFTEGGDAHAEQVLADLEAHPDDTGRQQALAQVLAVKATQDASFAAELEERLAELRDNQAFASFVTQVYGHGKIGQQLNVQGGDVHLGDVHMD